MPASWRACMDGDIRRYGDLVDGVLRVDFVIRGI